jgi:ribosomal-protein-alanine N-acetyltransferase
MQKLYETERLYLKTIDESYAEQILKYWIRNKEFLKEWVPSKSDNFYCIETQKLILKNDLIKMNNFENLILWVFEKEDYNFNNPLGLVGFTNIIKGSLNTCTLGYLLDKDKEGIGFMTEALKKGIEVIFNEYKLHRIEANIMPKNEKSLNVLKALNFINEGYFKKYQKIDNIWQDHIHLSLINEKFDS